MKIQSILLITVLTIMMSPENSTTSYFEKRMTELGITAQYNQVNLWRYNPETKENELAPQPIFKQHSKGIEIVPYNLDRSTIRIEKEGSKVKRDWSIVRLEKPIEKPNGDIIKYLMPKGQGSYPLLSPNIIDSFDKKEQIPTLFFTEGFFKAWKGFMHGLYIVGLPSITHMKNKEKGTLHPDVLRVISVCDVKRCVWLTDGDCLDITSKEITDKKDLYTRPANFFGSVSEFKRLLDDHPCDKYFFHVDSDSILKEKNFNKPDDQKVTRDQVKGLDDILITFPDEVEDIIIDLNSVSRPGMWFQRFNVTNGLSRVRDYFRLNDVTRFYEFHCERRPDLKGKDFRFHGTTYRYNDETNLCEVRIPGDSQLYFRVGDDYYKHIEIPNKHKQREKTFRVRKKTTIIDDHGREFVKHIPKYEAFCNVPNNVNFQPVIDNCYNVYNPMEHAPDEETCTIEDCPTIISFIQHIFGFKTAKFIHPRIKVQHEYPMWQLGLDYFQLLYHHPAEKLPILCLVSRQNNTGKSTMGNLLRLLFGGNVAIVGNQDIAGDFNAHWSTKLVVVVDESKIDKQHVVEKVKALSTANKITMNAKGRDHIEIDCYIKFIFITNHEDSFITMTDDDIRYWVLKVPVLKEENPNILDNFVEEIPAFLSFLNNRKLCSEKMGRMWFHPHLIRTDALKRVIAASNSTVRKELTFHLRQMFLDFGVEEIRMSLMNIRDNFFKNKEGNYLERVLKDEMKMSPDQQFRYNGVIYKTEQDAVVAVIKDKLADSELEALRFIKRESKNQRYQYPKWDMKTEFGKAPERVMVWVKETGRPYVFKREDFLEENETSLILPEIEQQVDDVMPTDAQPQDTLPF